MKYYITIGILLASGLIASAAVQFRTGENKQNPQTFKIVPDTATTTKSIAERYTHFLDSEFVAQGACVKIKDSDGNGYTYLSVNDGVGSFSALSCE